MLESNGMLSKKNLVSLETDGGVKVLSQKTGYDDNFQKNGVGPESIPVIWRVYFFCQLLQIRFHPIVRF
jgi:hypothetical protein